MPDPAKRPVPPHTIAPRPSCDYVEADSSTRSAGLGYGILRALGAHEGLSADALRVIGRWSAKYGAEHGGITPNPRDLRDHTFAQRVGPTCGAPRAAWNAACYPGGDRGQPRYSEIYHEVWVEQRWPELCDALSG